MNRAEVLVAADRLGIREEAFSIEGGLPPEQYVLSVEAGGWAVYYSERGRRVGEERFDTEDEACDYLLMKLANDPTTRRRDYDC